MFRIVALHPARTELLAGASAEGSVGLSVIGLVLPGARAH
jgi:hypothetical protein